MRIPVTILFALFVQSCSLDSGNTSRHDSIEAKKDSLRADADRKDAGMNCCFQSEEQFAVYFPDTCGNYIKQSFKAEFNCNKDTLAHNTMLVSYTDENGHLLDARITEYCAFPGGLVADWEMKFQMHAHLSEFNEFDSHQDYHGFSCYNSKKSEAYILVVIDDRFLVEITDQVCKNTKGVLNLYEHMPLTELTKFRK